MLIWFAWPTVMLILGGLYFALFASPADYQQGETVRIMYIHVPAAWMALFVPVAGGLPLLAGFLIMIGFLGVQTLTDLFGHGAIAQPETLGAWFDRAPDSLILDQRAFWLFPLVVLVVKGAGALSLDRLLGVSPAPAARTA